MGLFPQGKNAQAFKILKEVHITDFDVCRCSFSSKLAGAVPAVYYASLLILVLFFSTGACVYQGSLLAVGHSLHTWFLSFECKTLD